MIGRRLVPLVPVFGVYLAVSIGLWWHVWSTHPSGVAPCGCGDTAFVLWFLEWPAYALSHGHSLFHSTLLFHPTGVNLLSNASALAVGVPLTPITLLFGPVATLNVAATLAPALSALAMFWLLRRWVRWTPAAFIGGLFYGFSPFVLDAVATSHLMIGYLVLPPLMVACLDELLIRQRRPPFVAGALLGLLVTIQFFLSTEVLAITVICGLFGVALLVVYGILRDRRDVVRRTPHAALGLGIGAVVAVVLLAYPLWFTFAGPANLSGPVWPTLVPGTGGITLSELWHLRFATSETTPFIGGYLGPPLPPYGYLGLGMLVVLGGGLVVWRRDRRLWFFGGLGLISVGLSLDVLKNHFWVPSRVVAHVPVIQSIIPGRFLAIITLCAAIMLGLVADRAHSSAASLTRRAAGTTWARHGPVATAGPAALIALGVAAVAAVPLGTALIGRVPVTVEAVMLPRWFADIAPRLPPGQVVLAYPPPFSGIQAPMAWQAVDSMNFAQIGGGGPPAVPARAGRERAGQEVLTAASLSFSGPAPATPSNIVAVRQALAGWGATMVVVPDPSGLSTYQRGTSPAWALGVFTAAIGRAPEFQHGAWVWAGVQSPSRPRSISSDAFARCTANEQPQRESLQQVPDCVIAASSAAQ